jgi:hypothetical protein
MVDFCSCELLLFFILFVYGCAAAGILIHDHFFGDERDESKGTGGDVRSLRDAEAIQRDDERLRQG